MAFEPTHVVPQGGVPAWQDPDGSQPPAANLAPGTELRLVDQQGQWGRVEAANGWTGWVDAARLARRAAPAAPTAPPVAPPVNPPVAPPAAAPAPPVVTARAVRQPAEYASILATPGQRLGAYLLDVVLALVTLGIGWIIWAIVSTWPHGQTPAKKIMGLRVLDLDTGLGADRGKMAMREIVIRGLAIGLLSAVTLYIMFLVASLMIFSEYRQALWDRWSRTVVISDPGGTYDPAPMA